MLWGQLTLSSFYILCKMKFRSDFSGNLEDITPWNIQTWSCSWRDRGWPWTHTELTSVVADWTLIPGPWGCGLVLASGDKCGRLGSHVPTPRKVCSSRSNDFLINPPWVACLIYSFHPFLMNLWVMVQRARKTREQFLLHSECLALSFPT